MFYLSVVSLLREIVAFEVQSALIITFCSESTTLNHAVLYNKCVAVYTTMELAINEQFHDHECSSDAFRRFESSR